MPPEVGHDNVPGGAKTVSKPGGPETLPYMEESRKVASDPNRIRRVAEAYVKKALYWASKDRQYRASGGEIDADAFNCPKCKEAILRPASYKRQGGQSEHLLGCPHCLFLIKKCDIIGHPDYVDYEAEAKLPFARIRLGGDS